MSNENERVIHALAEQAKDTSKPLEARRTALRHICQLRDEPAEALESITAAEISFVVAGMLNWPKGIKPLSLHDALEAVREGRIRRTGAAGQTFAVRFDRT